MSAPVPSGLSKLRAYPIFASFSPAEHKYVTAQGNRRSYSKGTVIYLEDEPGDDILSRACGKHQNLLHPLGRQGRHRQQARQRVILRRDGHHRGQAPLGIGRRTDALVPELQGSFTYVLSLPVGSLPKLLDEAE
jgi:hypothetical protein